MNLYYRLFSSILNSIQKLNNHQDNWKHIVIRFQFTDRINMDSRSLNKKFIANK